LRPRILDDLPRVLAGAALSRIVAAAWAALFTTRNRPSLGGRSFTVLSRLAVISAIMDAMGGAGLEGDRAEIPRMQVGVRAALLRAASGASLTRRRKCHP
jgi:hypothetical protein